MTLRHLSFGGSSIYSLRAEVAKVRIPNGAYAADSLPTRYASGARKAFAFATRRSARGENARC